VTAGFHAITGCSRNDGNVCLAAFANVRELDEFSPENQVIREYYNREYIKRLRYCCLLHGPSRKFRTLQSTAAWHANAGALALAMIQNYESLIHGQSLPFEKSCATSSSATQCGSAATNIMSHDDC
jgi:hypothetical protein